jgi:hypothetical protein
MSSSSDIRSKLKAIVGIDNIPMSLLGSIVSVDETEMTCEVTPNIGGANFTDVRLMADNETTSLGIYFKPKVGSQVMISPQDEVTYFVSMVSEVDEVWLRGNTNGGIVKVTDLVTKLNNIENDLNTLKTAFTGWVVVPSDGGAALKVITATWAGQTITQTTVNDLESDTVKHG